RRSRSGRHGRARRAGRGGAGPATGRAQGAGSVRAPGRRVSPPRARSVPPRRGAGRGARRCDAVQEGRAGRRLARGHGGDRTLNTRGLMKLRNVVIVTAAAGLALATGGWLLQRQTEPTGSVYQQARLFEDVLAHVADFYVDSVEERRLYQMAIDGMLDQLHDPYSVFLKRDDFRALNEATTGNYGGLGIQIDVRDGWITVVAPLPDTPAERAGIQSGDQIIALDGRSTEGWKNDQAVKQLRGEPGSALELDLRGDPGGLLDQGVAVSELFLDPGQEVVETRGRAPTTSKTYRDAKPQPWPSLPVVVLTNGGTASAAEIITGALQDHDRAVVVGTPTFGKGLVQSLWQLTPETALKLTTARWFTPSGRTIQRKSKNEEDQFAQAEAAELGHDSTKVDSSLVFHTDHGRAVLGGGGIRPDLFVTPDTFTTAERAFVKALGNKIPTYWDVRTAYALEIKTSGRVKSPDFSVTAEMADEVIRRLRARGVALPDSVIAGARHVIAQDLGYEIARYGFGRP